MPIYVYRCDCGERFERLVGIDAPAPGCPACGGTPQKIPAGPSLLGQAAAGLAKEQMPQTYRSARAPTPAVTWSGSRHREWCSGR
jgi:putative FmdB family regulatory protein